MPTTQSYEARVKEQYARYFAPDDAAAFKTIAEYYLRQASKLKKKDIQAEDFRLPIRDMQKRLFIGLGCELLMKAYFLRNGYCINKPVSPGVARPPHRLEEINPAEFRAEETFTFNELLDQLPKIIIFKDHRQIMRGFKIAKVFRNMEGHAAVYGQKFDPQHYRDIEAGLTSFYYEAFSEAMKIRFSFQADEKSSFKKEKPDKDAA
jgi:hypothetical protein